MAVLSVVACAPAIAAGDPESGKPSKLSLICTGAGEKVSGLTKICYFNCGKSDGAMTVKLYDRCPRWTSRWQLKRTDHQYGPNDIVR